MRTRIVQGQVRAQGIDGLDDLTVYLQEDGTWGEKKTAKKFETLSYLDMVEINAKSTYVWNIRATQG